MTEEKTETLKLSGKKEEEKRNVLEFDTGGQYPRRVSYFKEQKIETELTTGQYYIVKYDEKPMQSGKGVFRNLKAIKKAEKLPEQLTEPKPELEPDIVLLTAQMEKCKNAVKKVFGELKPEHIACVNSMFIEMNKRTRGQ